jgi:hypothetical protein
LERADNRLAAERSELKTSALKAMLKNLGK